MGAWEADPERDAATELMYREAERRYAEIGERHGYSGEIAGVAAVLREIGGLDVTERELSDWHNDLVGFHDEVARGEATFPRIARAMDVGYFGTNTRRLGAPRLDYPFQDLADGSAPYGIQGPDLGRELSLDWIAQDVARHLKDSRIRRGTAKHNDFLRENAAKVVDAATTTAITAMERAAKKAAKALGEAEALAEKANAYLSRERRRAEVRAAALRAAEMDPDPTAAEHHGALIDAWERAASHVGEIVQRLADERGRMESGEGAAETAIEAIAERDDLRPFLDAAGIPYDTRYLGSD